MTDETKDLTTQTSALPMLPDPQRLREIFETNFEGITPSFETIKMPSGGATIWAIPGDEKPVYEEELIGIIIDHYGTRTYWPGEYTGGKGPPMCKSTNLRTGSLPRNEDGEFGECISCKWSKFGTATKQNGQPGKGQACHLKHRVFFLMPDRSILPYLVALSVTSSTKKYPGSISTFVIKQSGGLKGINEILTKIKLQGGDHDEDGNEYSKAQFFKVRDLTEDEIARVAPLAAMLKAAMRSRPFEVDEIEGNGNDDNGHGAKGEAEDPWNK